jgi:cell division septation protein DedD
MSLHLDDDYEEPASRPTELTLSTGVIVGAVFGLVLLCALFFGLGYSVRGGTRTSNLPAPQVAEPASSDATFSTFKPAAGSPLNSSAAPTPTPAPIPARSPVTTTQPSPPPAPVAVRAPAPPAATPAPTPTTPQTSTGFYVQVAAVSHQQDADKLAGTLHAEGYLVTSRTSPQDTLFHVQIGPYATRKDADLIRQKLIGEGYTPIVK